MDWSKWHVFYADERCVPLDHEDSNHRLVSANFISKVPILAEHVHTIDPTLPAAGAAAAYEAQLVEVLGDSPALDLLLLGMGPDGHTCSLFPGHALLAEDRAWIAWVLRRSAPTAPVHVPGHHSHAGDLPAIFRPFVGL